MASPLRLVLALSLIAIGLGALDYGLLHLLQIGTCAAAGPDLAGAQCPAGTVGYALLIPGGSSLALAGLGCYAHWRQHSRRKWITPAVLAWSGLILCAAATSLAAVLDSVHPGPGAQSAGPIAAVIFATMGLIPLLGALVGPRPASLRAEASA